MPDTLEGSAGWVRLGGNTRSWEHLGDLYIKEVVPKVVEIAVRMVMKVWMMTCQMFFFITLFF